jgi:hypothetical protein
LLCVSRSREKNVKTLSAGCSALGLVLTRFFLKKDKERERDRETETETETETEREREK